MEHVEENVRSAGESGIGMLTKEEEALVERVRELYQDLCLIPCTGCSYCMPCPNGVDIPHNFKLYNDGAMYERENPGRMRGWYKHMLEGFDGEWLVKGRADVCIQCRECEAKCPQNIPISEIMPVVHQVLGENKAYDECPLPAELKR